MNASRRRVRERATLSEDNSEKEFCETRERRVLSSFFFFFFRSHFAPNSWNVISYFSSSSSDFYHVCHRYLYIDAIYTYTRIRTRSHMYVKGKLPGRRRIIYRLVFVFAQTVGLIASINRVSGNAQGVPMFSAWSVS